MHDPFFDEDDGEFDDLYGNPRPSASSFSIKLETRKNETRVVPPVTPGSRPSTRSPLASSSVVSRSYVRDRAGSTTSNLTDLTASGKPDKRRKRRGRPRRKSSQELFDVQWESDVRVAKCGLCRADFSLVKRKHHCRHCGRVMCSDCSSFLYFELSHRKHRVCVPCNNQLLAEQDAYDRETLAGQRETGPSSSLFDGADDDWFTDVPKQQASTRDSEDSDRGGSKGPGWRDRVKDTYTVTSASDAVLVPMAGSTLTAGITGNGYISDQFRYDVSGPGLGHEDDLSVAMPRPRQQTATTYADHSVKSSRLTGNGYYSEQFQYDVSGPGLGHDDDRSLAMPRPKQQTAAVPYSYDDTRQSVFSGTKPREATVKKEKKPRARGDESMTMDELNLSYSSEDEPRVAMPRPTVTSVASTLYDKDADKLVVDDSPGFFEATVAEREAQRKKDEEQQRQLASDMAWVNSSALPPSVPAHRFSSGQESYSIVDLPSHTSNSPVESRQGRNAGEIVGNTKGGFTGALKRFFGMGSKEAKRTTTPPKTYEQVQPKTERKRRGTFDDLFESPKNNVAPGVGVSRFDRRRSVDEADGFTLGDEPQPVQNSARTDDPIEAWRQSAAMSILNNRSDTRQSETSAFTWSNVRSTPALGTATYAVPTSLQPSASSPYESLDTQAALLGNIMDDLNRNATSKPTPGKESVDDFFAEFEEPNDYVFDPATGGYVAARVPPRAQQNDDGEEVEDEVAEIIVDKISSLESELAALKLLIRNRKGSGGSKPRVSHRTTRPSVRKQSIFDNDSSEEEGGKKNDSVRPVAKRESKRRPPSKKKPVKKRRDSFADLFEDSPNEQEGLGGATSYEALFQTGAKTAEANNDEDSDDDAGLAPKSAKRRPKSRRRSSRKIKAFVPGKEGSNSEQEFTSLKGRRGKQSRRKESEKVEDTTRLMLCSTRPMTEMWPNCTEATGLMKG
ncbi:uncharacterized protein PITG_02456 [Phytophthora infestans T30-4]|uniref:FYVE-type domain-containing protein n=1 Tax=Phytophthora infestans (strain T30-4) TaxID=403677 RepID=D0MWD2_PHYIT|nr:uncharacterized protein PITG_02456 [Phytophthora infestans T30-4]EEY63945.1 conserved hypothetical protein [Phytophthora infestans T30-4]|eukprot:XP_002907381.1 conserved hypothetical protein [Phytophthora infestans T30-4]